MTRLRDVDSITKFVLSLPSDHGAVSAQLIDTDIPSRIFTHNVMELRESGVEYCVQYATGMSPADSKMIAKTIERAATKAQEEKKTPRYRLPSDEDQTISMFVELRMD